MVSLVGGAPPSSGCSACPARTCTCTGRTREPGRKLGHVTLVDADEERVAEVVASRSVAAWSPGQKPRPYERAPAVRRIAAISS